MNAALPLRKRRSWDATVLPDKRGRLGKIWWGLPTACTSVRTVHLEARWAKTLARLSRTLYHVLIAGVNVGAKCASHSNVALLLLLSSYLDIGHVILYVLHVVGCILIGLICHHQMIQKVLFYIFLRSLIWSWLARLLIYYLNVLSALRIEICTWFSLSCPWWETGSESSILMKTVSECLAVWLLEPNVIHLVLRKRFPTLVKVWDLDTSHWSDLLVCQEAKILFRTIRYSFDTTPLAASFRTARRKTFNSSFDTSMSIEGHFCLAILIVGGQRSLLEIF